MLPAVAVAELGVRRAQFTLAQVRLASASVDDAPSALLVLYRGRLELERKAVLRAEAVFFASISEGRGVPLEALEDGEAEAAAAEADAFARCSSCGRLEVIGDGLVCVSCRESER